MPVPHRQRRAGVSASTSRLFSAHIRAKAASEINQATNPVRESVRSMAPAPAITTTYQKAR